MNKFQIYLIAIVLLVTLAISACDKKEDGILPKTFFRNGADINIFTEYEYF